MNKLRRGSTGFSLRHRTRGGGQQIQWMRNGKEEGRIFAMAWNKKD